MSVKRIDHIAIVVESIKQAAQFYEDALEIAVTGIKDVPGEEVKIAFLPIGESEIELLEPINPESGIGKFLASRGPGMHHICLEVEDIDASVEHMKAKGIRMLSDGPKSHPDGKRYIFAHPKDAFGVLIELYQLPR